MLLNDNFNPFSKFVRRALYHIIELNSSHVHLLYSTDILVVLTGL